MLLVDLALASSSFYPPRAEPVRVSLNGDSPSPSASASSAPYTYHAPSRLATLSPSCGPALGDTLVELAGLHLAQGDDARCRFGSLHVEASRAAAAADPGATALRCRTPRLWAGLISTEVTLNGQDHTTSGFHFFSYPAVRLSRISPTLAPEAGGTLLSLHGPSLSGGCDYRCRYGGNESAEVRGTYNALTGGVECYSLPAPRGETSVQLTLNGQAFSPPTAAASLLLHAPLRIDAVRPAASPLQPRARTRNIRPPTRPPTPAPALKPRPGAHRRFAPRHLGLGAARGRHRPRVAG